MAMPSGVVTFVFSDIEGSTRLWESDPDGMRESLARHDEIVGQEVEAAGGRIFKHTGDGFGAAFQSVTAGMEAASSVAAAVANEGWPGPPLIVRLGVHSGEAEPRDGDYFGPTVNRTARLMDAGNGGQIVVSGAAHQLVGGDAPDGMSFMDMGEHRLKDLGEPISVYRLLGAGASDERQLRTLESAPHNLPVQLSSFVGREGHIKEIADLVRDSRLVTLTGIGGVGKTRLSLQVAAELLAEFDGGVWFVELAPITEIGLIPDAIGTAIGVKQDPTITALERVTTHLADRRALLVVDNCEHVIDEIARLVELILRSAPDVHVLTTSREGLAVTGEALWRVPSLRVDDDAAAVELFADRARLVRPDFAITDDNREIVAELCARLDGIPLAIELATARLKMMSVEQVAEHLGDRFRLLTGGSRTAVERQRTLRAMMDWSYDLLDDQEQMLLRRLAVFYDGFSYEAAEQVCSGETLARFEVLDLLGRLVEASMVVFDDDGVAPRYRLLETVRQYSLDKLVDAGESDEARMRHALWVREFALTNDDRLLEEPGPALLRGRTEIGNVRAALTWALEAGEGVLALEIGVGMRQHFWLHVQYDETLRWLLPALDIVADDESPHVPQAVAYALIEAGNVDDFELVATILPRAQALFESVADPVARGELANAIATPMLNVDPREADRLQREAHIALREAGSNRWVAPLQNRLITAYFMGSGNAAEEVLDLVDAAEAEGLAHLLHGDVVRALFALLRGDEDEVLRLAAKPVEDEWQPFMMLQFRAILLRGHGRLDEARDVLDQAAAVVGAWGKQFTAWSRALGEIQAGRPAQAVLDTLPLVEKWAPQDLVGSADLALVAGLVATLEEEYERAAMLIGFGFSLNEKIGHDYVPIDRAIVAGYVADLEKALGEQYAEAYAAGASMAFEDLPLGDLRPPSL